MPTMDVGSQPAAPAGGLPMKWILLGGGALVVAFLMMRNNSSAPAASSDNGVSVAGALTGLQQDAKTQYGGLTTAIQGLSAHLDSQAAALSDQGSQYAQQAASSAAWSDASLFQMLDAISRQVRGLPSPSDVIDTRFPVIGQIGQPSLNGV